MKPNTAASVMIGWRSSLQMLYFVSAVCRSAALLWLAAAVVAAALGGCGSSGSRLPVSKTAPLTAAQGRASFTFTWPKRPSSGRLIPVASSLISIGVIQDANPMIGASQDLVRPTDGATTVSFTFPPLQVGTYAVTVVALPYSNGGGPIQAQAQTRITIVKDQITSVNIVLEDTITKLTIVSPATTLGVGQTTPLIATPTNAKGDLVLTLPSTTQWVSSNPAVATVDATGVVTGVSKGTATITATETESGTSDSRTLAVGATDTSPAEQVSLESVAYQMNPGHTGTISFGQPLIFPAQPAWSVELGGRASYPIVAGGHVFVVASNGDATAATLYALDEATGKTAWGPVALGGTTGSANIAYEQGKLFTLNAEGILESFDAATGRVNWRVPIDTVGHGYIYDAPPTAIDGVIYIGGSSRVRAFSETDGSTLWSVWVNAGDYSSPALSFDASGQPDGVFVSYPYQVSKFAPVTGALLWQNNDNSGGGGGGKTPVYANHSLYARYPVGTIYDAATGGKTGEFAAQPIPAIGAKVGYFLNNGILQATDLSSQQPLWSFTGDGQLTSAPIVIGQSVIVGSATGSVFALDAATGSPLWSGAAGAPVRAPEEHNGGQPLTGIGAGEGYLVVPATSRVTAWRLVGT